ncbi:hypothetical protein ABFA07_010152 [Porites harrisoni]
MPFATGFSLTKGNSYLANNVIKTLFMKDWISCTLACQVEEMCVSYNYNTITRACDLNVAGIHEPLTGADELVKMHGVVFHQIKNIYVFVSTKEISIIDKKVEVKECWTKMKVINIQLKKNWTEVFHRIY